MPYQAHDHLLKLQAQRVLRHNETISHFLKDMRAQSSRHLVLVVMLNYKSAWSEQISFDDLQRDYRRLANNIRSKSELRNINGYIARREEGADGGGLHLHMVIFYNGQHRAGIHLAQSLGEYWANTITEGRGAYWNGNYFASQEGPVSPKLPWGDITGQLDRSDTDKWQRLESYVTEYLGKETQPVAGRDRYGRTFTTSRFRRNDGFGS